MKERIWDYSTISSFQTCRKKYYFEHVRNLRPQKKGLALTFGSAIHDALDTYYTSSPAVRLESALKTFREKYQDPPEEELRTVANGVKLLETYASKYKFEPFTVVSKPEMGFVFPIGDILFGGRVDLPVEWNGALWIVEHKTTTRLTAGYFDQYELDKQPTGYIIAAEECLGKPVQGCLINALEPWKDLIRPTAKSKQPEDHFLRHPITRSTMLKDRFKLNVQRIVRDIQWCEENNEFQEAEKKEVCQYYNRPCPYLQLCKYGENEKIIANEFVVEEWKPFEVSEET